MSIVDDYNSGLQRKMTVRFECSSGSTVSTQCEQEITVRAGDTLIVQYEGDLSDESLQSIGESVSSVMKGEYPILILPSSITLKVLRVE